MSGEMGRSKLEEYIKRFGNKIKSTRSTSEQPGINLQEVTGPGGSSPDQDLATQIVVENPEPIVAQVAEPVAASATSEPVHHTDQEWLPSEDEEPALSASGPVPFNAESGYNGGSAAQVEATNGNEGEKLDQGTEELLLEVEEIAATRAEAARRQVEETSLVLQNAGEDMVAAAQEVQRVQDPEYITIVLDEEIDAASSTGDGEKLGRLKRLKKFLQQAAERGRTRGGQYDPSQAIDSRISSHAAKERQRSRDRMQTAVKSSRFTLLGVGAFFTGLATAITGVGAAVGGALKTTYDVARAGSAFVNAKAEPLLAGAATAGYAAEGTARIVAGKGAAKALEYSLGTQEVQDMLKQKGLISSGEADARVASLQEELKLMRKQAEKDREEANKKMDQMMEMMQKMVGERNQQ